MPNATAIVPTEHASRYLQQLCKHWSHRFAVDFTPGHGRIDLGDGKIVTLDASATNLSAHIEAPNQAELPRLEKVVEEHILRFAFREELSFKWTNESIGS